MGIIRHPILSVTQFNSRKPDAEHKKYSPLPVPVGGTNSSALSSCHARRTCSGVGVRCMPPTSVPTEHRGSSLPPSRKCHPARCTCRSSIVRHHPFFDNVQPYVPLGCRRMSVLHCWPSVSPFLLEFVPMQIHVVQEGFDRETLWETRIH